MTPQNRIDTAINNAAARMTGAKPSNALRSNVMSRIARERPARFAWRYVFAGGALASVALVAFVSWPANPAIPNRTISNPTLINPTVINSRVNPTAVANAPSPVMSVARTVAAHDSGQPVPATLSYEEQEWLTRMVPALGRPELMAPVKPLLEGAPIEAIDIEPIRVAPLMVRAIGDDDNNQ